MTNLLQKGRAGARLADYDVIDFHGHLGWWFFGIPDYSPDAIVASMNRLGVKRIFVSSMECMGARADLGNDEVLAAMRAFPRRFLGYAVVWPSSPEAVQAEIEKRLAQGFSGIKLHVANGFDYTCPTYMPAFEIANERRLPVLLHTYGEPRVLAQVRGLASLYKDANFVLAHAGVANIDEYIRLANEHENVCLDLCGSVCVYGVVEKLVESAPVEKIVWGSDTLFLNMPHQIGKVLGADIPEAAKKKILSSNAARLLAQIRA
jgi:hypothetical protein